MRFFKGSFAKVALANALLSVFCAEGSIFIVTDTNDTTRAGSLRGAIIAANARGSHRGGIVTFSMCIARSLQAADC